MKCPSCGYKHEYLWDASNGDYNEVGDEKFIRIGLKNNPMEIRHEGNRFDNKHYKPDKRGTGYLYACPKCLTVILEANWEVNMYIY